MQSYLFFSFQVGEARAASGHLYARVGGRRRGVDPIFNPCLSVRRIELTSRRSADAFKLLYIFPATREPWSRNPDKTMRHVRIFFWLPGHGDSHSI